MLVKREQNFPSFLQQESWMSWIAPQLALLPASDEVRTSVFGESPIVCLRNDNTNAGHVGWADLITGHWCVAVVARTEPKRSPGGVPQVRHEPVRHDPALRVLQG